MNRHPLPKPACRPNFPHRPSNRLITRLLGLAVLVSVPVWSHPATPSADDTASPAPASSRTARFVCFGEPLQRSVPRMGAVYDVTLTVAPELAAQRVSIFARSVRLETLTRAISELLSDVPDSPIRWQSSGPDHWRLEQPQRRPALERLHQQNRLALNQLLEPASPRPDSGAASSLPSRDDAYTLRQKALAAVTHALTPEMRSQLHAEEPVVRQVTDLPASALHALRNWIRHPNGGFAKDTQAGAENGHLVFLRAPHHEEPLRAGLSLTLVSDSGQVLVRASYPDRRVQPNYPRLSEGPGPRGNERPVSLQITGRPHPDTGRANTHLDDMLAAISEAANVTVVSDGYQRPALPFPHSLTIEGWALDRLMDAVAGPWRCDWRFLDADKRVILVRARYPWLEDAADVSDETAASIRNALGPDRQPLLADFIGLARLNPYQIRRLAARSHLRDGSDLLDAEGFDGTGVLDGLRFLARLPRSLRTRAESPIGLPLGEAPQAALRELRPTLLSRAGAVTPSMQQTLAFRVRPEADPQPGQVLTDYVFEIREAGSGKPRWSHRLRSIRLPGTASPSDL